MKMAPPHNYPQPPHSRRRAPPPTNLPGVAPTHGERLSFGSAFFIVVVVMYIVLYKKNTTNLVSTNGPRNRELNAGPRRTKPEAIAVKRSPFCLFSGRCISIRDRTTSTRTHRRPEEPRVRAPAPNRAPRAPGTSRHVAHAAPPDLARPTDRPTKIATAQTTAAAAA